MVKCLLVGVGGGIGAMLRYLLALIPAGAQNNFPIKTLLINVIGAFNFCVGRKVSGITTSGFDIKDGSVWWIYDVFYICVGNRSINTERELRICDTLYRIKCDIKCCCGVCCTNTYEVTMKR